MSSVSSFLPPSFDQHLLSPQDDAAVAAAPLPPPPVPAPTVAGPNCKDQTRVVSAAVGSPVAVAVSIVAQQEPSSPSTSTFLLAKATPVTDSQINEELVQLGYRNRELQSELERLRPSPPTLPPPRPPTNRSATSLLFLSKTQQMVQFGMGIAFTVAVTIAMGICALLMIPSACVVGGTAAFNRAIRSIAATTAREPAGVPMAAPTLKLEVPTVSPVVSSTESPTTRPITTTASTSTAAPVSFQSVYINAGGYSPYEDAAGRV
jgi:hypothetical protein